MPYHLLLLTGSVLGSFHDLLGSVLLRLLGLLLGLLGGLGSLGRLLLLRSGRHLHRIGLDVFINTLLQF